MAWSWRPKQSTRNYASTRSARLFLFTGVVVVSAHTGNVSPSRITNAKRENEQAHDPLLRR